MSEDAELLRQYAQSGSETAFAELVGRHLPLVYATALRQGCSDGALAKDVAQTVFIDLARKASSLLGRELLAGWLYTSTRLAASKAVRGEHRRQLREQIAASMQEQTTPPESQADQAELRLVLDEAMSELDAGERNAVLIRFFQGKELKEVGSALGISEDAARMRITRALANLQTLLKQRGVTITTVALGTALATEAAIAVPAGLAAGIAATAVASAAAGTVTTLGIFKSLALAKWALGTVGVVLVGVLAAFLFLEHQRSLGMSYSVKGTFSIQSFTLPKEGEPLLRGTALREFEILLDDSAWKIRVVMVGNTNFDSFIGSYDGTNKLQYFILAWPRPTDDPMSSVSVEASPVPTSGSDFEYPWLAFASGQYFKGQSNHRALSFGDLRSSSSLVRRYEVPCRAALSASPPYLPTAVDYVSTNWATFLEDDGTLTSKPLPESFGERGYASAEFRSSGFTNVHGLSFPTSFECRHNMLRPDAKGTNDLSCVLRVRGTVTSISSTNRRVDCALPAKRYMVGDLRIPDRQVLYPISDGRIPAVDSAVVKAGHVHGVKSVP